MDLRRSLLPLTMALLLAACASAPAGSTTSAIALAEGSRSVQSAPRAPASAMSGVSAPTVDSSGRAGSSAAPASSPAADPFVVDLYRPGTYSMQATWWWCTAAGVQMLRNILLGQSDHTAAAQGRYFDYMRARNGYRMPAREGVDLTGLLAGLRHFVDAGYRRVASSTYDASIASAVTRLRFTGRPIVLIVMGGRHLWLMTGFTATADPASGSAFRVLSVRVVGPLYGRQSRNGYDPPPDTTLSARALETYFLPYHFKFGTTPWDGRYVAYTD